MSSVNAIFHRGVFEPLEPVNLPEEQRVRLSIEPVAKETPLDWLECVRELHAAVLQRHGPLPDSAQDIAEDRQR